MGYAVEWDLRAERALRKLPESTQRRIVARVDALADDPRPQGSKKLEGGDLRSLRVGEFRVLYLVSGARLLVLVVDVGHRKNVYKGG